MGEFLAVVLSGLASGSIYGLVGLGIVIIFRATDVVNFAAAALGCLSCYLVLAISSVGVPVVVAFIVVAAIAGGIGVALREVVIRPLGTGQLFSAVVVTMGVSLLIESGVSRQWGEEPRSFPGLLEGDFSLGGYVLRNQQLLTIGVAVACMLAIGFLFKRTLIGAAMRATAESPESARAVGIDHHKIARLAWFLGCALATVGVLLQAPLTGVSPTIFAAVLFRAFAGILLGGLTSMTGAVVGGFIVGVLDNLAAIYVAASFRDTFVFALVAVMLIARPAGLFGERASVRV